MRISDWSSDVCSSDLGCDGVQLARFGRPDEARLDHVMVGDAAPKPLEMEAALIRDPAAPPALIVLGVHPSDGVGQPFGLRVMAEFRDRKSVVSGKRVSVRVRHGGCRIIKKKNR